jgi:hypothetical protein
MITHSALAEIAATVYRGPWSNTVDADVHYALLPRQGEIVVALPGTHPLDALDWLRDFSFWPTWVGGLGLVHSGFGLGAEAAWARMAPILSTDRFITFTGHSLGGALAIGLAALHAYERPNVRFRIVTFGAPRVGFLFPWIRRRLRRAVERAQYARPGDIVPDAPMRPYLHGGRLTRIGVGLDGFVANHAIAQYVADLKALGL